MLLERGRIGSLELANRIIFAPHGNRLESEGGEVTDDLIAYYVRRVQGGAGLIEAGVIHAATEVDGFKLGRLGITRDTFISGLTNLVEAIHREGSKIAAQLAAGPGAMMGGTTSIEHELVAPWIEIKEPVSPSGIPFPGVNIKPRELLTSEVERIVELMGQAAYRAKLAGFDAVEVHAGGGYLISQFMSPFFNKRTDRYGEDRLRLVLEIIEVIRRVTGDKFPLIVRYLVGEYPSDEAFEKREDIKEAKTIAKRLEEAGVDAIHLMVKAFGAEFSLIPPMHISADDCIVPFAAAIKSVVKIPVILTGRMRDPEFAEQVLREGKADFIGMVRPLIADPDLPRKFAEGRVLDIRSCLACNECLKNIVVGRGIRCTVNPTAGRERKYGIVNSAEKPKKVMVVGAGPGGMEAARLAALRGHKVTLVEKEKELGGKIGLVSKLPNRKMFRDIISYYSVVFKGLKENLEIALASEVTPELIAEMEIEGMLPDVAVIATGGIPFIPEILEGNGKNVITPLDILANKVKVSGPVVIVGADIIGLETSLLLTSQGKKVTLVEMPGFQVGSDVDGEAIDYQIWLFLSQELSRSGIKIAKATRIEEVTDEGIVFLGKEGNRINLSAKTVVLCLGFTPTNGLAEQFKGKVREVYLVGDANKPRKIKDAIYEGFLTACKI